MFLVTDKDGPQVYHKDKLIKFETTYGWSRKGDKEMKKKSYKIDHLSCGLSTFDAALGT